MLLRKTLARMLLPSGLYQEFIVDSLTPAAKKKKKAVKSLDCLLALDRLKAGPISSQVSPLFFPQMLSMGFTPGRYNSL